MRNFLEFYESQLRDKSSFCYMLGLSEESKNKLNKLTNSLKIKGNIIKKDQYHCTIRNVNRNKIGLNFFKEYLNTINLKEIQATTKNISLFNNDYLVIELNSIRLLDWFNRIEFWLTSNGYPKSDYSIFKPHISLSKKVKDYNLNISKVYINMNITLDSHIITNYKEDIIFKKEF